MFASSREGAISFVKLLELRLTTGVKTIPIEVADGVLRLPQGVQIPASKQLAVLLFEETNPAGTIHEMADAGGAFDFLHDEPDLYSDADVLPDRRNPLFGKKQ